MSETLRAEILEQMESLTETQRTAASWDNGAFVLLAGPGSGKTRVLTSRIARILDSSRSESFRVLALTFTNLAADEMRNRIQILLPDLERRLFVGTFHSFCTDVLRQHGPEIGLASDFRIYSTDQDRSEILRESIQQKINSNEIDIPSDVKLLPILDRLRDRLIEPDAVVDSFRNRDLGLNVAKAYEAYDAHLIAINAQDFNSLILNTHRIIQKFPAIAKRYRQVYRYWNVDEFQDTNLGQYRLLKTLAGDKFNNLFVVADDDQIIYQWNGASYTRLEEFARDFEPEILQLPTNFRCPFEIVDLANRLVGKNLLRSKGKEPLIAAKRPTPRREVVRVLEFETQNDEAEGIATEIAKYDLKRRSGVAILARTRALLEGIHGALNQRSVHSRIIQRRDDFQTLPFIWLHACLKQSNNRSDKRVLDQLVGSFNELTGIGLVAADIVAEAEATEGDLLRTWVRVINEGNFRINAKEAASAVLEMLVQSTAYPDFIEFALKWMAQIKATEEDSGQFSPFEEDLRAWKSLQQEILSALGRGASLESFLQELQLRSKEPPTTSGEVALMTIHGAKGKEFDEVILIGLAEDILPSFQSIRAGDSSPEMEEERRNCFVAITRTKRTLTLSYSNNYRGWSKKPSRFLTEMTLR